MVINDIINLAGLDEFKDHIVELINNHVSFIPLCWVYYGSEDYDATDTFFDITINNNKHTLVTQDSVINCTNNDEDDFYLYIIYPIDSEILPKFDDSNFGIKGQLVKNIVVDTITYTVWKSLDTFNEGFKLRIL